jgi:hypothetical protein
VIIEIMKVIDFQSPDYDSAVTRNSTDPLHKIFTAWRFDCTGMTVDARPVIARIATQYLGVSPADVPTFVKQQQEVISAHTKVRKCIYICTLSI